jgi:hypothetical protein
VPHKSHRRVDAITGSFESLDFIYKQQYRAGLEESACECYAMVRGQFERLLGVPRG